ncbi:hypothetical protein AB0K74_28270 [Streptomyces sp. NPDC056159]|uniref:hypothetical protein n=1 Tax=Streptomyces sp. NPDC056159 TaxID=3155537 RepID=UPI0034464A28
MAIERAAAPENRGALRVPRARTVPLSAPPPSYAAAVERYLTGAGIAKSSARISRISLTTWGWMLRGGPAPTGPARRGAKPAPFELAAVDDPELPPVLAELAAARADEMDADTVNRELSIARKGSAGGRPRDGSRPTPRSGSSAARRRRTARRHCPSRRSPPCGNWTPP